MSVTVTPPTEVAEYLERVRAALADLPAEEREELLADVEASLLDAASDSPVPLAEQLGPPERFAGELRAAAGLAPAGRAVVPAEPLLRQLARRAEVVLRAGRELAPVWWALRGYLAVAAIALLAGVGWSHRMAVLPKFVAVTAGGRVVDVLVPVAAIAVSLWIGRRWGRRMLPLDLILAVAAVPVLLHLANPPRPALAYYAPAPPYDSIAGFRVDGLPVDNIFPYDRDGKLLHDVRLYDGAGRPIDVGSANRSVDPLRRRVVTATGERVLNAFPIRYFEQGTHRVARPGAGPAVRTPRILTPALKRGR